MTVTMSACPQCQAWQQKASDVWLQHASQITKLQALVTQVIPYLWEPMATMVRTGAEGLLHASQPRYDPLAAIVQLAAYCPHTPLADPAERSKLEGQRTDLVIAGQQLARGLAQQVSSIRPLVEQVLATSPASAAQLDVASLKYFEMMDGVLTRWRDQAMRANSQWEAMYADHRRRQQMIDRREVAMFSGATVIDLFPWDL